MNNEQGPPESDVNGEPSQPIESRSVIEKSYGRSSPPSSAWRIGFGKYGPFAVHFALTALIAAVCLCFLDGRTFNANYRRPQYVEADGSVSHLTSYAPLQADITTAVSLAATVTRVAGGWWATDYIWRCIFVAMERGGISARGLSQVISNRPPAPHHFTRKSNMVIIYTALFATFAIDYFSAALTGSFIWEPTQRRIPGRVPLTGITRGVNGTDMSGYFNHRSNQDLIVAVGSASAIVAWGTLQSDFFLNKTEPSTIFRRVIKGAQYISTNSALNITMPYFALDAFEWLPDPDQVLTDEQLPLFNNYGEFSPYFAHMGIGDPHIVSETRLLTFRVGRFDSNVWPCPQNYMVDPGVQINLHGYRFPGYYTDCFAIANVMYRAGAISCQTENCRLISSTGVEAQAPFSIIGDSLTSMALGLAQGAFTGKFREIHPLNGVVGISDHTPRRTYAPL